MPPVEITVALLALGGVLLTAGGALMGAWVTSRAATKSAEAHARAQAQSAAAQTEAVAAAAQNDLIDQLQEELTGYRTTADRRAELQDERLTALEARNGILVDRNDRYRDLLHKHRSHIWEGHPPPPPEWPDDLPR